MAIEPTIRYADADDLSLDQQNPRLGHARNAPALGQEELLLRMSEWALEELMLSFLQSGFWPQEALVAIRQQMDGDQALVVVEGNRRLAALKWMRRVLRGEHGVPRRIVKLMADQAATGHQLKPDDELFTRVPYILAAARDDVDAYLGFRHVTGIKQWEPQEKASFIAQLIEDRGKSYSEVRTLIGSRADVVRRNYLALCILDRLEQQIEDREPREALDRARNRFSVFFLSLRERGVQEYLGLDVRAEPAEARTLPLMRN